MKRDSKLSGVLHVLLHMIGSGKPATSEELAKAMMTNPVVIRRVLAGLREEGFVKSEKGHGGGWTIACDPEAVTLADIYRAVGAPAVLAMGHRTENPECVVEQVVNEALDGAFREVEATLMAHLGNVTLGALAKAFKRRLSARNQSLEDQKHEV
jgi:DNA-binding IscR family transcriptional regulator